MGRPAIQFYGLREVAAQGGRVYVGSVEEMTAGQLSLRVERAWNGEPGATQTFQLFVPPQAQSPLESVRYAALIGGTTSPDRGDRVIVVDWQTCEVLRATPENLRKLDILFDRVAFSPTPADLADRDLALVAYDVLVRAGELRAGDIARGDSEALARHYDALDLDGKRQFLVAVTSDALADPAVRRALLQLVIAAREPGVLVEIAPILAAARPDHMPFYDFWRGLADWDRRARGGEMVAADLSPLADCYDIERWHHDEFFARLFERLDAGARVRMIDRIVAALVADPKPTEDTPRRARAACELAAKIASPSALPVLARIDPWQRGWIWPSLVFTGFVVAATEIVRADRAQQRSVQAWLEPMLACRVEIEGPVLEAWRALVGAAPPIAAPPAEPIALAEGEHRYLACGVWFARSRGRIEARQGGDHRRLDEGLDESPLRDVFVATEAGTVAIIENPGLGFWDTATALATTAGEAAGCGAIASQNQVNGVMIFTMSPRGDHESCTIRVGLFTGRVRVEHQLRPRTHEDR